MTKVQNLFDKAMVDEGFKDVTLRHWPVTNQEKIIEEILTEREYQDHKWGGPDHDDTHCNHDWDNYITKYLDKAFASPLTFREQMIKVAALAVAAAEWHDRGQRK